VDGRRVAAHERGDRCVDELVLANGRLAGKRFRTDPDLEVARTAATDFDLGSGERRFDRFAELPHDHLRVGACVENLERHGGYLAVFGSTDGAHPTVADGRSGCSGH